MPTIIIPNISKYIIFQKDYVYIYINPHVFIVKKCTFYLYLGVDYEGFVTTGWTT